MPESDTGEPSSAITSRSDLGFGQRGRSPGRVAEPYGAGIRMTSATLGSSHGCPSPSG